MKRHMKYLLRFAFLLCLSALPVIASADESGNKRILLLYYDNQGSMSSWVKSFDTGLHSAFGDLIEKRIELDVEYTDLSRNPSPAYQNQLYGLFRMKYGEAPPDIIIVNMNPYSDFLVSLCNDIFPEAKIVFALYDISFLEILDRFPGRATGVYAKTESEEAPALIQQVLPDTKNIFIINGASQIEKAHVQRIATIFNAYADRFNITYLIGIPIDELTEKVRKLPKNSAVYFNSYLEDAAGKSYESHNVISLLSKQANAPIFSFYDMYLESGLLGGEMISSGEMGKTVAQLTLRILDGVNPLDIQPFEMGTLHIFNWKQMQKWGIDEKRLPEGSIIKYREYSFFERYKRRIILWATVVVLQFCLITYLIITLGLRRRAQKERARLETALRQAQKMETIGTLAGGIAHDFNNILSAIIGYTELTQMDMKEGSKEKSNLAQVLQAGERAKDLVNQILAYARKSQEGIALVPIRATLEDVLKLLRSTTPSSIEIRKNLVSDSEVLADKSRLHQVFLNVCTNAVQAMEGENGILSVDLSDVTLEGDSILPAGEYLKIWISDTGKGIPREHLDLIFDPYFTTKEAGKGTGLGLSVVLGIVEKYGGEITVDSELDRGTTFTIYLPVSKSGPRVQKKRQELIPKGSEGILFVDDEPAITEMCKQYLERQGYQVTCVNDGATALEIFKEKPDRFDIVITDMAMPRMNGDILASKLGDIRPDIPVILCTGYSQKLLMEEVDRALIKAVLIKPVSQKELAATIRQVLA